MNLAIVGIFYDGYYNIWEDFLELFDKYWPDCPYPLYIVNDSKDLDFKRKYNVTVLHAGKNSEYSQRVQKALESIDADYYLLLLEDFFVGKPLVKDVLKEIMNFIISHDVKYYRMPLGVFTPFYKKGKIEKITPKSEYTLSCQPSIWKKNFLKQAIGTQVYNAWVFEGIYTKSKFAHTEEFLEGCYVDYRNCLGLYHGALQGKLLNSTDRHFRKIGYEFKSGIPLLNKKKELKDRVKYLFICITPLFLRKKIKSIKKTDSIVDRYDSEIQEVMDDMGIN